MCIVSVIICLVMLFCLLLVWFFLRLELWKWYNLLNSFFLFLDIDFEIFYYFVSIVNFL